jgi:hypothetical protein
VTRYWLAVIEDVEREFSSPKELESYLEGLLAFQLGAAKVVRVQRGGLLADRVMAELPPVRHRDMGRPKA